MSYFNYFSQCEAGHRKSGAWRAGTVILCVAVIAALCAGLYGWYVLKVSRLQAQLDYLNELKLNESFMTQYAAALSISEEIDRAEREYEYMRLLDEYAAVISTVNPRLTALIDSCLAGDITLDAVDIQANGLTLQGTAPRIDTLLDAARALRASGAFSSVLLHRAEAVSEDTLEDGETEAASAVKFELTLFLNGGAILGEVQE